MNEREFEIKNAIIEGVTLNKSERNLLDAWLYLKYASNGQGFGGYALYLPDGYANHSKQSNFAGHFIFRCLEIAGVDKWEDMVGQTIRVRATHDKVHAIGHIVENDWFSPEDDFKKMDK